MESGWQNREIVENPQVVLHNNHDIPLDIIHEILAILPLKSILRFKAVSKLWYSTISNPTFRRRCSATSVLAMSSNTKDFYLMDEEGGIEKFQVPAWSPSEYGKSCLAITNSCNGMLLLRRGTTIFLFNPSTRYICRVLSLDKHYDNEYTSRMGFCYDESISDYKAIIFLQHSITADISSIVASLKKKEWTALCIPKEFFRIRPGPLMNDRLHLMVSLSHSDHHSTRYNAIVYFNPIKYVFEKVACPQPKLEDKDEIIGLGVLDDCLCLTRRIGREYVEVLKMKEYGVAESWTTLFAISHLYYTYHLWVDPLLLTKNGDILMMDSYYMSRYNLAKKKYTHVTECGGMEGAVTLEENLFSPKSSLVVSKYTRNICVCLNCGEVGHTARDCSSTRSYGGRCFDCGKQGHLARECSRGDSRCYNCGKPGHFARDCRF